MCAFVAAGIYAYIANRQLIKMDETYNEIKQQTTDADITAKAAKQQADMLRQQLIGTQGVLLQIKFQMLNSGQLSVDIEGSSPTLSPQIKPYLKITAISQESVDGRRLGKSVGPFTPDIPKQSFDAMHHWEHEWAIPWADIPTDPPGPPKWTPGWPGKITKVTGVLIYDDGFGDPATKVDIC